MKNVKLWNCGNMKVWKYGNGKVPATLVVCIFAYLQTFPFAYSSPAVSVWRGETAYVDLPAAVQVTAGEQTGVTVAPGYYDEVAYEMQPDGVDIRKRPDVYRECENGAVDCRLPTACRITVAADAKPGIYNFGPIEVTVLDRVLPPAKDWKYFLDLWQHPWAVSRYFNVEPFSKEHYAKMEPIWRALAECGCKALTVTLLDLPWNHQCYDGYYSMIGRVKQADGTWAFDYSIFDEYVEFGRRCGLGPDIACYTMCPWGYRVTWKEEKCENVELCKYENMEEPNGVRTYVERREKFLPGTPEFEDYWGPFLVDFAAHLKEKGWFADAYIAMDERKPEDVKLICEFIQRKVPGMKVAMAGNKSPSEFEGITIDNYCQGLIHLRKHPKFLDELAPRRAKGYKTTFYVCCTAAHPNTFMESPDDEGFWLGAYPVMVGFDGFLRWAANSWPADPYKDASFNTKNWKAGDTFLIYPNGEPSARLIALRAGIVAAEKMRILGECESVELCKYGNMKIPNGGVEGKMAEIAKRYGYKEAVRGEIDFAAFRREVEALVNGDAQSIKAVSPDGRNELRLDVGENGMAYSVWRSGKALVEPTRFSLSVEGHGTLNGAGAKPEITVRTIEGTLATPLYKKSSVDFAANETRVDFGDWAVVLHARNDGVAWRFETKFEDGMLSKTRPVGMRI